MNQNFEQFHNLEDIFWDATDVTSTSECTTNQDISTTKSYIDLLPQTFETRGCLLSSIHEIAIGLGYATTIKKSKKEKYVIIGCDRGGTYKSRDNVPQECKKRGTSSRLINCPFEIWGKKKKDGVWRIEIKNLSHNHDPSDDMSGHPSCRRFTVEEISLIKEMSMAGIPPRQIITSLRQNNPNSKILSKDLHNMRDKIMREILGGRSMIQALLDELGQGGFMYDVEYNDQGRITHLFFAHPDSLVLTRSYSHVFVMDCTYKTNRYKMPMLDIVGITSFNTSFNSCFAFLEKEAEWDYTWALKRFSKVLRVGYHPLTIVTDRELALINAIREVFPKTTNLLCMWHINKNILTHCKSYFDKKDHWDEFLSQWTHLVEAYNEATFNERWCKFESKYTEKGHTISYIKNTWLPYKDKFVYAWTNKCTHFGIRVSSKAEGAHSMLKRYLQVSTGNLRSVKEKICLAINNQFKEVKGRLSSEKVRIPHRFCIPSFKDLVTHVSMFALDELLEQYKLAQLEGPLLPCKGHFSTTMGLPCAHVMKERKNMTILLEHIHDQWRIDTRSFSDKSVHLSGEDPIGNLVSEFQEKYQEMTITQKEQARDHLTQIVKSSLPLLREPNIQCPKGRPTKSKNKNADNSTRRDPSAFEMIERSRKCGICKQVGHNSRTCPGKNIDAGVQLCVSSGVHMDINTCLINDLNELPDVASNPLHDHRS